MNTLFILLFLVLLTSMMGCVGNSQAGGGDASGQLDFDDRDFEISDPGFEDDPTPVEVSDQ